LVGAPGFRVEYSIDLMPHYQQYLNEFQAQHGQHPKSYQELKHIYKIMTQEIKENMPKFPSFQPYFHLLDVISFFCYVLHSLKKRVLMPILSQNYQAVPYTFPNSLPPYPVRHYRHISVKISVGDLLDSLDNTTKDALNELIKSAYLKGQKKIWDNM